MSDQLAPRASEIRYTKERRSTLLDLSKSYPHSASTSPISRGLAALVIARVRLVSSGIGELISYSSYLRESLKDFGRIGHNSAQMVGGEGGQLG